MTNMKNFNNFQIQKKYFPKKRQFFNDFFN